LDKPYPEPASRLDHRWQAEADHVAVTALDARNQRRAEPLDGVATSLVEAFPAGYVAFDVFGIEVPERHQRAHDNVVTTLADAQRVSRVHVMISPGEPDEERSVLLGVTRLVDDLAVD